MYVTSFVQLETIQSFVRCTCSTVGAADGKHFALQFTSVPQLNFSIHSAISEAVSALARLADATIAAVVAMMDDAYFMLTVLCGVGLAKG